MHLTFNFKYAKPTSLIGAPCGLFGLTKEFSELYALALNSSDRGGTYHIMNLSRGASLCSDTVDMMNVNQTGAIVESVCQSCRWLINQVDSRGIVPVSSHELTARINPIVPSFSVNTNYGAEVVEMVYQSCKEVKPLVSDEFTYGGSISNVNSMIERVEKHYVNSILNSQVPEPIYFTALTESGPKLEPIAGQSLSRVAHVCASLDSDYFKIKFQRLKLERYAFARLFERAEMGVLVLFSPRVILLPVINLALNTGNNGLYGCMPPTKPVTDSQFGIMEVLNFVYDGFMGEAQAATVGDVVSGYMKS